MSTQLQFIIEKFKELEPLIAEVQIWKNAVQVDNPIDVIFEIRKRMKKGNDVDNRILEDNLGTELFSMISNFNPVVQAEIMLEELFDLWQHKWKVNKDSKDFKAIIKLNHDIDTLFQMAKL